jgi:glucoamylase
MLATWIETAAKGRLAGPVRAGMWSAVVIGTHPVQENQRVWLELAANDRDLGQFPAYWIENKGGNSFWHAPVPPQDVGTRMHYRSVAKHGDAASAQSGFQDTVVRPNLPQRADNGDFLLPNAEGLVGNRLMTVRVDARGSTYDVYFPTVGLHSKVRPREGDLPYSRCHFRAIIGGMSLGRRLDWFTEREAWECEQKYLGATNILTTKLIWRRGPIHVLITDLVAMGKCLPLNAGREESPGQYLKRFWVTNHGDEAVSATFGVFVQAEINGGVGDVGLSWHDTDQSLLAINRGHGHANRKLSRDATIEFAIALDHQGNAECEPTGPNEAIVFRQIEIPARSSTPIDLLVSGAFTGWSGDRGTFEHWLRPALHWFRTTDLDRVEQTTAESWDDFVETIPDLYFPQPTYGVNLRRSALAAALHADAEWGAIASGFDRGLSAYCWPRDAIATSCAMERVGQFGIARDVYRWLHKVREKHSNFRYWFQKYSIDGFPEWETPAVDQTAITPWGLDLHYRRTGDRELVDSVWPMVEDAAAVCCGDSGGHPGLRFLEELNLITSAGSRDQLYGAFLYSNAAAVAGLRAAARLAIEVDKPELAKTWSCCANRIWRDGILKESYADRPGEPGMFDVETGRFLQARRFSRHVGIWSDRPERLVDRSTLLDITALGLAVPFGLLPASDPRLVRAADQIIRANEDLKGDRNILAKSCYDPTSPSRTASAVDQHEVASVATFWMIRYLIQLGRETGQGRRWTRAVSFLDAILGRLSQLGLVLRPVTRGWESAVGSAIPGGTSARLHSMLIDTLLDFAGLDYDAVRRRLSLSPALPSQWPQMGSKQRFPCGEITYQLERPIGGKIHQLDVQCQLDHPARLDIALTCPELGEVGPWQATPDTPEPAFDRAARRVDWSIELPAGRSSWNWTWG